MVQAENRLVWLLRGTAVVLLSALVPVVMPFAWMQAIHRQLGMGDLPDQAIVGYLTRSLSAMYALHGGIVLFVASDVRRYLPIVKLLATLGMVFGVGTLVLDVAVGMPCLWILCEGPFVVVLCGVMLWLALAIDGAGEPPRSRRRVL